MHWDQTKNALFYGDNLDILRDHIHTGLVDLVYLDPPFNSKRDYSLLFKEKDGTDSAAQLVAFEDTWTWNQASDLAFRQIVSDPRSPIRTVDAIQALRTVVGETDMFAYLVMMTQRLVELHRVLKPQGSLYLHCDPTASHYLKIILDSIFGPTRFRNEVIWKRTGSHNSAKRWGPQHDVILFYSKGDTFTWNREFQEYDPEYVAAKFRFSDARGLYQDVALTGPGVRNGDSGKPWRGVDPTASGRHWQPPSLMYDYYERITGSRLDHLPMQERLDRADDAGLIHWPAKSGGKPRFKQYLEISPGVPIQDVINDIRPLNSQAAERLEYPTQKPVALLERIIQASTNPGDLVLDPFCGCGTSVDAAQRLGRRWVGIDITTLSVDLMDKRLKHTYGASVADSYEILGVPRDVTGARALFKRSPFEFERWCVTQVGGQPNEKQVGDKGVDGVVRFPTDARGGTGKIIVSVKGGNTNPGHIRDLLGTVESKRAAMGIFLCMNPPTRGMIDAANTSGTYTHPATGQSYPRIQILTVQDLVDLKRPNAPGAINPYYTAKKYVENQVDVELF